MQGEGIEWGEDYRQGARDAVADLLRGRMDQLIEEHLERIAELGAADRRNGCYRRHLLTELGDIELAVPRTRTFSALTVVRAYARRAKDVDRMIRLRTRNPLRRCLRSQRGTPSRSLSSPKWTCFG